MKSAKLVGWLLIGGGGLGGIGGALILVALYALGEGSDALSISGMAVGLVLLGVIIVPVVGLGIFLLWHSRREAAQDVETEKQRQILDMVATRGEVRISDIVLELKSNTTQVQQWVYTLVGMGLFSGYINWEDGILYSRDATKLKDVKECLRCGGDVSLSGRGVSKCKYCGTEYFL